jgi:hypothetical protein
MSIEKVHLRKLLQLFYASPSKRRSALLSDLYNQAKRDAGENDDGGDFHAAFWSDAKRHAGGEVELRIQTNWRIERNERRKRLYPLLADGFLSWWNEKRRWRNERFSFIQGVKGQYFFPELNGLVKVEGLLAVRVETSSPGLSIHTSVKFQHYRMKRSD